jgi:hypothetical protein
VTDAFDDAAELEPSPDEVSDADLAATVASLVRSDVAGVAPGAVERAVDAASSGAARLRFAFAWNDAMDLDGLGDWIAADAARRARGDALAVRVAPPDPSPAENACALAAIGAFTAGQGHAYPLIIVPGYTPLDLAKPSADLHPIARRRLELAVQDFQAGLAPVILVTGGAVYPRGTPYAEGLLMKQALLSMSVPEERVLVDARARHSTTNLRNAGRIMLGCGMERAVIVTLAGGVPGTDLFGQDFYFSHPVLSTFYRRCEHELGYQVGDLTAVSDHHIAFVPSPRVREVGFRDALDP